MGKREEGGEKQDVSPPECLNYSPDIISMNSVTITVTFALLLMHFSNIKNRHNSKKNMKLISIIIIKKHIRKLTIKKKN